MNRYKIELFVDNKWGGRYGDAIASVYAETEEKALDKIKTSFANNGGKGTSLRIAR
jgi:hypothetical protein